MLLPLLPSLLVLLALAVRTGSGIRCYSAVCRSATNDTGDCVFRRDAARLKTCHYGELLETHVRVEVGELAPSQSLHGIRDQDMQCIHIQSTAVWSSGMRKVDYRACIPPDPQRCQIMHNSTIRKYEGLYGHHGTHVHWDCAMCATDSCNSGDTPEHGASTSHSGSTRHGTAALALLVAVVANLHLLVR